VPLPNVPVVVKPELAGKLYGAELSVKYIFPSKYTVAMTSRRSVVAASTPHFPWVGVPTTVSVRFETAGIEEGE
jgi:hypothetical protein